MKTSIDILKEHFEQLKQAVPEIYAKTDASLQPTRDQKLFEMIKKTLSIIEAVYFQNKEMFTNTRAEEYSKIVAELKDMGYNYLPNDELIEKAAAAALMKAKLPMEKAKGRREGGESKQAM